MRTTWRKRCPRSISGGSSCARHWRTLPAHVPALEQLPPAAALRRDDGVLLSVTVARHRDRRHQGRAAPGALQNSLGALSLLELAQCCLLYHTKWRIWVYIFFVILSMPKAFSNLNSPILVRSNASQYAPTPSFWPISCARLRIYVPVEHSTSIFKSGQSYSRSEIL